MKNCPMKKSQMSQDRSGTRPPLARATQWSCRQGASTRLEGTRSGRRRERLVQLVEVPLREPEVGGAAVLPHAGRVARFGDRDDAGMADQPRQGDVTAPVEQVEVDAVRA